MPELTFDMILVMLMIGVAVFLFIVEWVRVDVVAILMMVTLPLLGLVAPKEAFSGLSSNAVVSIIAVIIIGAGLDRTGVINLLVGPILRLAGKSQSRIIIFISVTVAVISSFMQNIGAAALFLPAIQRISKNLNISISRLLMPIGFSAILGGTITLVGSSPLILLNDLIAPFNLEPFGLFDVTPVGLALVATGILCFVLFGRFILPGGNSPKDDPEEALEDNDPIEQVEPVTEETEGYWELRTPQDFTDYREPITVDHMRRRYLVNVVALTEPPDFKVFSPEPGQEIRSLVDLAVFGREKDVMRLAQEEDLEMKPALDIFKSDLSEHQTGTVEAVVAPRSVLAGRTLAEAGLAERFRLVPLMIYREGETYRAELDRISLRVGDSIVLHGNWTYLESLHDEGSLLFTTPIDVERMRPEKAVFAGLWLALALIMIMVFKIQLSVCLMTGALGMILTKVLTIDEAYAAVDWRTVFLLGGLIPLGIATEKTGAAAWIAQTVLGAIGTVPPIVLLSVIGLLSTIFTLVVSNVGATVLLVPLVVNMAIAADVDPRIAAMVVGLATSNSFILPTHQVNALYMGPGRYRSVDFMKAGSIISVLFLIVMVFMLYVFY